MSEVSTTTSIKLPGLTLAHHCRQTYGRHSWRVEGLEHSVVYFTGTVDELRAFAREAERVANDVDWYVQEVRTK